MDLYNAHKDFLVPVGTALSFILLSLFKVFVDMGRTVENDDASKKSVAMSLLEEKFVDQLTDHHKEVSKEISAGVKIEDICARDEYRGLVNSLSGHLKNKIKLNGAFKWARRLIQSTIWSLWIAALLVGAAPIHLVWACPQRLITVWTCAVGLTIAVFLASFTAHLYYINSFRTFANDIIQPEPDDISNA